MSALYHYTCDHGRTGIGDIGELLSPRALAAPQTYRSWPEWRLPMLDLIWLTDLDVPDAHALGLTRTTLSCDRTEFRYEVADDPIGAEWWPRARRTLPRQVRAGLENAPGALPAHWWISRTPVPVVASAIDEASA